MPTIGRARCCACGRLGATTPQPHLTDFVTGWKVLVASRRVKMTSREHVYLLQMIKGMKDKLAQDAIGTAHSSDSPTRRLELLADQNPLPRIRFRLRDTGTYKPRQQIEAEGQVCPRRQAGPAHRAVRLQRGMSVRLCNNLVASKKPILIVWIRRSSTLVIAGPS